VTKAQQLIDGGLEALLNGERGQARRLLQAGLAQDPRNEQGWLALSFAVDKREHALECVQRALALDPENQRARDRLADLEAAAESAPVGPPTLGEAAPATPLDPTRWSADSAALHATGDYFYLNPEAANFVRGHATSLPMGHITCVSVILIPIMLMGLVILFFSARDWTRTLALRTGSSVTTGTVVSREKDDSGDDTDYYVTYRFVVDDHRYEVTELVSASAFNSAVESEPLTVRYVMRNPEIATIGSASFFRAMLTGGFGLIWCAVSFGLGYVFYRTRLKRRRLARDGQLIDGSIVSSSGRTDSDGDFTLKTEVRFRSPRTGKWIYQNYRHARNDLKRRELPGPGTLVHVLYIDDKTFEAL
jgi:hypothetical protein